MELDDMHIFWGVLAPPPPINGPWRAEQASSSATTNTKTLAQNDSWRFWRFQRRHGGDIWADAKCLAGADEPSSR